MNLPLHGRIECADCHNGQAFSFDRTRTSVGEWRITNNPMAWGNSAPEIVVLGFSKGPEQAGALASQPHDKIAYRKGRTNVAKILHHVRLLSSPDSKLVDHAISDRSGRFHFGSLIRCTVERYDAKKSSWTGTGGGMLDKFAATDFGTTVIANCSRKFLAELPSRTRLVIMFGMGTRGNYVRSCRMTFATARPGPWRDLNEVSYSDGKIVVVHTEHFAAQGALLPNWLSGHAHPRGVLGLLAREAVKYAGVA
jgi:hypothetical protein